MMIHAYSELYLDDAMESLGEMFSYVVNDIGYNADHFFQLFIISGIAEEFGKGNPKYIAGLSGIELAREIVFKTSGNTLEVEASQAEDKDEIYWAGWSLAYYQWYRGKRFKELYKAGITISKIKSMYVLHEADISKFVEEVDKIIDGQDKDTNLKRIRKARGLTQKQLSESSGVTLRMIQLYEQKQNDISHASVSTVQRLANVLGCGIEDLVG